MRSQRIVMGVGVTLGLLALATAAQPQPLFKNTTTGDPKLKSIEAISFGPKGMLLIGDGRGSQIVSISDPLDNDVKCVCFSTETYHVAHNQWETKAPIRTVLPYEENGKKYLVGAFTCTPVVKYALDDLQPGAKVKGMSVIELGAGNTPQGMFTYAKRGKKYILMNTKRFMKAFGPSPYWTVRIDYDLLHEN